MGLEPSLGHQVYRATYQRLQVVLQLEISVVDRIPIELDEHVYVAVFPQLVAGSRSEQAQLLHAKALRKLLAIGRQRAKYLISIRGHAASMTGV